MFYLLNLRQTIQLREELKAEGIIVFQSAKLDLNPSATGTNIIDNTAVNLLSARENVLLHISIRRPEDAIVFNSRIKNGAWGAEERVPLEGKFTGPDPSITVYDHGDRFQIMIDYATVHYYNKRIQENSSMISYSINENQVSPFSDTLAVDVYTSFASIMPRNNGLKTSYLHDPRSILCK